MFGNDGLKAGAAGLFWWYLTEGATTSWETFGVWPVTLAKDEERVWGEEGKDARAILGEKWEGLGFFGVNI